jgi:hypothetical protein
MDETDVATDKGGTRVGMIVAQASSLVEIGAKISKRERCKGIEKNKIITRISVGWDFNRLHRFLENTVQRAVREILYCVLYGDMVPFQSVIKMLLQAGHCFILAHFIDFLRKVRHNHETRYEYRATGDHFPLPVDKSNTNMTAVRPLFIDYYAG